MKVERIVQLDMYEMIFRIRTFEMKARELFLAGQLPGFLHLYPGQEAIATGVCANLLPTDQICSTHRGHGHCIAKGGSMHIADPEFQRNNRKNITSPMSSTVEKSSDLIAESLLFSLHLLSDRG